MTEPGTVEMSGSARVAVTPDDEDDGTRHHDLTTRELRDAHQAAWETYLRRLCIRAGGDPGPEPPLLGRGQQRDRPIPAPVRDLSGDGWRGMMAPMTTRQERLARIKAIAEAVHTRRQLTAGDQ